MMGANDLHQGGTGEKESTTPSGVIGKRPMANPRTSRLAGARFRQSLPLPPPDVGAVRRDLETRLAELEARNTDLENQVAILHSELAGLAEAAGAPPASARDQSPWWSGLASVSVVAGFFVVIMVILPDVSLPFFPSSGAVGPGAGASLQTPIPALPAPTPSPLPTLVPTVRPHSHSAVAGHTGSQPRGATRNTHRTGRNHGTHR